MKNSFLGKVHIEKLSHFLCAKCKKWWSIGDAPNRKKWCCPWCGYYQAVAKHKKISKIIV